MAPKMVGVCICGFCFTDDYFLGVRGIIMTDTEEHAKEAYEAWENHEREETDFRLLGKHGALLLQWVIGAILVIGVLYWLIF